MKEATKREALSIIDRILEERPCNITDAEIEALLAIKSQVETSDSKQQIIDIIVAIVKLIGIASNYYDK